MKRVMHLLSVAAVTVFLATSVYAGACCDKAVAAAKDGKACATCAKNECCKEAIKKIGNEAKPCKKCAKKSGQTGSGNSSCQKK